MHWWRELSAEDGAQESDDVVEGWKLAVRRRLRIECVAPSSVTRVSSGFAGIGLAVGALNGVRSALLTLALLGLVMTLPEAPRVLVAVLTHRRSRLLLSAAGSELRLDGPRFGGARAFAMALMGPATSIAVSAVAMTWAAHGSELGAQLRSFAVANAAWAVAHALPIPPFPLGAVLASRLPPARRQLVAGLTLVCLCQLVLVTWLVAGDPLLLATVACISIAAGRALRDAQRASWDARHDLERVAEEAEARLAQGAAGAATTLASRGLALARTPRLQRRLWRALAWGGIGKGDPPLAHAALLGLDSAEIDVHLLASYLACCNRVEEALELLDDAREVGHRAPETSKLHIDLLLRRGDTRAAHALAAEDHVLLSVAEQHALQSFFGPSS